MKRDIASYGYFSGRQSRGVACIFRVALVVLVWFLAASLCIGADDRAAGLSQEGARALERGAFRDAVVKWTEAISIYEESGDRKNMAETRLSLGQAYMLLGQHERALDSLGRARHVASEIQDNGLLAKSFNVEGNVHVAMGRRSEARGSLARGLELAKAAGAPNTVASLLNDLGNLQTTTGNYRDAVRRYRQAGELANRAGNAALAASATANAARASLLNRRYASAKALLDAALRNAQDLADSYVKVNSLTSIGVTYNELRKRLPSENEELFLKSNDALIRAVKTAGAIKDVRGQSYALGFRGGLYEEEKRYSEALELTRRAVFKAQEANSPESLYRWQWQTGRLLKALGNPDGAIAAYKRAVYSLKKIRNEMSKSYGATATTFRKSIGPVYFELVDLLLQHADEKGDPRHFETSLAEARNTVELFKAAELRDYFRDDCVDDARSRSKKLDVVSSKAAIIYPIVLPDRAELLLSLPTGLKRYLVPVNRETVAREVRQFRRMLEKRTSREYLPHAQKLYDWLLRPVEDDLGDLNIETLVFVPDGALRTIPMAAIHDGQEFLIEKYAVAITPGLELTDPTPVARENVNILAAGLTQAVQHYPPLPYVADEMNAISQLYGNDPLMNEEFVVGTLEDELKEKRFNIVHLATHGQFKGDLKDTFLLTYDDKLTMDRLDQYVGLFRFRDEPLDLLMLSACETAAGDDRAALGLAGIAVKAGARSAVATLWFVNDQASAILIEEFYKQLKDPTVSRAVALQRAQRSLLEDPFYRHPGYWSPFLLINNWL